MTETAGGPGGVGEQSPASPREVVLRVPAVAGSVALARSTVAAAAAAVELTVDRIDDLRLAVDEAVSLLLEDAVVDSDLVVTVRWGLEPTIDVTVSTQSATGRVPGPGGFSWTVLSALVDDVSGSREADGTVRLLLRTSLAESVW